MPLSTLAPFVHLLGKTRVLQGEALAARYAHIWQQDKSLKVKALLLPRNTDEVSGIMRICHQHRQAVVMHGGLTNLVGGTEASQDLVVISTEKMNQIEEIDPASRSITVQAGVILETVQEAVKEQQLFFPLNFGAKGSAQIGGIIATNAGGLRVFRYGMTRQLVLGLEAVLADGTVISSMKKLIKDNSGYDLRQLFIGSEGTLGIVTRAVLKLVEAPRSRVSAWVALAHYDRVVDFLKFMDGGMAGTLSGFELMWEPTFITQSSPPATVKAPIPYGHPYYVLLEGLGSDQAQDQERMISLLEKALAEGIILEAAPASSESERLRFWKVREEVDVMAFQTPHPQQFDISLPIPLIGEVIAEIRAELERIPEVVVVHSFGHVADGNIHILVGKSEQNQALIDQINEVVYRPLTAIGGSVSAEHGIGEDKKPYLSYCRTEAEIQLMRHLKRSLDPFNLLNPGKLLSM
ncbi:MAG: FAD-binding oxidoreductase [Bacteroidota bacterium]